MFFTLIAHTSNDERELEAAGEIFDGSKSIARTIKTFFVSEWSRSEWRATINATRDIISRLFDKILIGLDSSRARTPVRYGAQSSRAEPSILIIAAHIVVLIDQPRAGRAN